MIKVGLIGCGDVATHSYMPGLNALGDRAKVVAVFDIVGTRAEDGKRFHPDAAGYTDFNAFLAHGSDGKGERMDLVFNLTPAPIHKEITARAFEAGYCVYSEKPLASSLEDANELVRMADEKGLTFFCAPATMVTSRMIWLKELMEQGTFGNPYFIQTHIGSMGPAAWREYSGDPRIFYTPKVGPLIDLGVYMLHAMTGFFGPATHVQAMGGTLYPERTLLQPAHFGETIRVEVPDLYSINIAFADNRYGHMLNTFAVPRSRTPMFELHGSLATASINSVEWYDANGKTDLYIRDETPGGEQEGWQEGVEVPSSLPATGILDSGILHALDVLQHGVENVLTAAHAMHVLEIMIAAGQSLETGKSIEIETAF